MISLDRDTLDNEHFNHVLMTSDDQGFKKGELVWINFWDGLTYGSTANYINRHLTSDILNHSRLLNGTWWGKGNDKLKILKFKSGSSAGSYTVIFSACHHSNDLRKVIDDKDISIGRLFEEWELLDHD